MESKPPQIRDDLVTQEIKSRDGSVHYVIKDPITRSYFKVGEQEYFIIRNLDGHQTNSEIVESFKKHFESDLPEGELNEFVSQLQELCFLDNDLTRQELLQKQREADRDRPRTLLGKLVFLKLKAFDPGKLFDRLIGRVRFLFTRRFVWFASLLIIFSSLIALSNARALGHELLGLLNLQGIVLIYLSVVVVVILHEFAHGLTCRYYGGEVRELGFLLIYFQPAFYCNVSDAWLFPEKSKRLLVSFSGAFFQIFIWAVAIIAWRATQQDILLNKFALATITITGIGTLFNFNPLLRYDGYYLLSDYVEIPNLRTKARKYWIATAKKLFLSAGEELKKLAARERRIYFYYGILSFFYIVFILGYFFLKLEQFLVSRLGGIGLMIFAALMVFLFRNLIADAAKGMVAFFKAKAEFFKKRRTLSTLLLIVILVVLISVFGRWQLRIKGELVLNPVHSLLVKYNSLGYVQLIRYNADNPNTDKQREVSVFGGEYTTTSLVPLVTIGDNVHKGQIVARLANSETSRFIDEYTARLAEAEEELILLQLGPRAEEIARASNYLEGLEAQLELSIRSLTRMNEMIDREVISRQAWEDARTDSMVRDARVRAARNELQLLLAGTRPEEIGAKEAEIDRLKSQINFHKTQQDFYELRSPIDGVVMTVDTGEVVCEIANLDTLEATIILSEKELADIAEGQKVKFKVRGYPSLSFYGTVYRIGKKILADENDTHIFKVLCRVTNEEDILKPGMTGVANVYCGKRKISYLIYRKFFRTIRTEFWDWFDWF